MAPLHTVRPEHKKLTHNCRQTPPLLPELLAVRRDIPVSLTLRDVLSLRFGNSVNSGGDNKEDWRLRSIVFGGWWLIV